MRLEGYEAITFAEQHGLLLNKYRDPVDGPRQGLTPEKAREIAAEDPSLIYLDTQVNWLQSNPFGNADLNWITPPRNRGQIVEVSYASDGEFIYKRVYDGSDRSVEVYRASWDEVDAAAGGRGIEFEPWNYAPDVDLDLWERVS